MKHLLEQLVVKDMALRNRLVMPPMVTNFASKDGEVTERMIDYYSERARGGTALIIIEMSCPHPTGKGFPCMLGVYSDALIPGLNELAEAIKSHGARVALQIGHAGRQTSSEISGHPILAPSAIPSKGTEEIPKEMSIEDIEEIAQAFGSAALRAKRAGFDAIELHGTHGYLLNQFLSPYANKRTDAYGGIQTTVTPFASAPVIIPGICTDPYQANKSILKTESSADIAIPLHDYEMARKKRLISIFS